MPQLNQLHTSATCHLILGSTLNVEREMVLDRTTGCQQEHAYKMPLKVSLPPSPTRHSFPPPPPNPSLSLSLFSSVEYKMSEEDWVTTAMEDDLLVADLLLRLNHVSPPPPLNKTLAPALHVGWIVRQRRSKSFPRHVEVDKKNEPMRASPTTPLSWSGATSASGGGTEGFEDSSRLVKTFDGARSEIPVKIDEVARKKPKRTKRKKTLAELKDEETSLLKERRNLKNALISLRLNLEKNRATNERLKRVKSQQKVTVAGESTPSISDQPQPGMLTTVSENQQIVTEVVHCNDINAIQQHPSESNVNAKLDANENLGTACLLPDLNLPFGEDSGSEVFR